MFTKIITNQGFLTSHDFDNFFSQITINNQFEMLYDSSFLATLRVILKDRIPQGTTVSIEAEDALDHFIKEADAGVCIVSSPDPKGSVDEFLASHVGFKENVALHEFLHTYADVRIAQDDQQKAILFIPQSEAMVAYHLIQGFVPKYLPKFFQEKPLTQDEIKFLASLTKAAPNSYIAALFKAQSLFDIASYQKNLIQEKVFRKMKEMKIENCQKNWGISKRNMEECFARYVQLCEKFSEETEKLEMAQTASKDNEKELAEYLGTRKDVSLTLRSDRQNSFFVSVCTTLDLFDSDAYENIKQNLVNITLPKIPSKNISAEKLLRFLDHCFSDHADCKIKVQGAYEITFSGSAYPVSCAGTRWENKAYAFNQHLEQHHCSGNYGPMVNAFCKSGDYIGAIEQITASVKSLNVCETSVTVAPFIIQTYNGNRPCVIMPNGDLMTFGEAMDYFDKEANRETNLSE